MKDRVHYVIDDVPVWQTVAQLEEYILAKPDFPWAALLDSAFDYPDGADEALFYKGINCFESAEFAGLQNAAPWLIPIRRDDGMSGQLASLLRHCHGRPMLSFIATTMDLDDLSARWAGLHWVKVIDDQRLLLRFADTRVLPHMPEILSPSQWMSLSGGISDWVYFDRTGTLQQCATSTWRGVEGEIVLDQEQLERFLQSSHPDAILALVIDSMPDIIPKDALRSEVFAIVREADELAIKFNVTNESDIFSLAVAALLTSGESNTNSTLIDLLQQKKWETSHLGELLAETRIV